MLRILFNYIVSFYCFISIFSVHAQKADTYQSLENRIESYFELPRESIYIHTNKTDFVVGENLWFKAYIFDRQKAKPFKETSNLDIRIFDENGTEIKQSLFFAKDGYSVGQISIDSTYKSGVYYLKASTNWSKNFKDDLYIQKFRVHINQIKDFQNRKFSNISISLNPVGGNLTLNTINTVGLKITEENGQRIPNVKGVIIDEADIKITDFKTNIYGYAKFNFRPRPNLNYYVKIKIEGETDYTKIIPKAKPYGYAMALEEVDDKRVALYISTNEETLRDISSKKFQVIIHKDGFSKKIEVDFNQKDLDYAYVIKKNDLYDGLNTISFLNENNLLISEILYFKPDGIMSPQINLIQKETRNDSISFMLKIDNLDGKSANLSLSILPGETISSESGSDILNTFYLNPYLKNSFDQNWFMYSNIKNWVESVNLYLINQSVSKYNIDNITAGTPPRLYDFERGIDIEGQINSQLRSGDRVLLLSGKDSYVSELSDSKFSFRNLYLEKGEDVKISILKENGKLLKPKIYIRSKNMPKEFLKLRDVNITKGLSRFSEKKDNFIFEDFNSNSIQLDEVFLEGQSQKLEGDNVYVPSFIDSKLTEIDDETAFNYQYITDIIKARGYDVRLGLVGGSVDRVSIRVKTVQSLIGNRDLNFPEPIIYIDGNRLFNFDVLYNRPTSDFESYYFDRSGASEGTRGAGGVIRLFTKKGESQIKRNPQAYSYVVVNGFEPVKRFELPLYQSYQSKFFKKLGVVGWIPELIIDKENTASFKVFDTGLKTLRIHIQGMNKEGTLISEIRTVQLNN